MAFVYVPKRKVVSVWRPIEFMVSSSDLNVKLIKVNIYRGGEYKSDVGVLMRSFYVSNGEVKNGIRNFRFDVSNYVKELVEPFDGRRPNTLGDAFSMANELTYKLMDSNVAFKVDVEHFVKSGNGGFEKNGVVDNYPMGVNEWAYGVNHSPMNGEDMYMNDYYPLAGKASFLSEWKVKKSSVLKCGLNESLYVSFYVGDNLIEGVRVKRYQSNGSITTGVYQWNGVINDGGNENAKIFVTNIGGYGINGMVSFDIGMNDLLYGDDVFLDSETVKWEVQYISNLSEMVQEIAGDDLPNKGQVIGFDNFFEVTETVVVNMDMCGSDLLKRVHWLNRMGGMDSKMFNTFSRKTNKIQSVKNRKSLGWGGNSFTPNDSSYRSVVRRGIESVVAFEIEEIVENEEAVWLEGLLESPCVYMEEYNTFLALVVEDSEIVPSDTDDGMRVVKIKLLLDNTNIKIE